MALNLGSAGQIASNFGYKILYWLGYAVFALVIGGVGFFLLHVTSFKIRLTYWKINGSVDKNQFTVDKPRKNRFKWNKAKTAWIPLWPLFNKKNVEPFPPKYVYAGNNVYGFQIDNYYTPAKISFDTGQDGVSGFDIQPIPYHVKNWQAMELKQNEAEFKKHSVWEENKQLFMTVLTAAICLGLVGLTVWWTYKYAAGGQQSMRSLADAIKGINLVPPR